MKPKMIMSEPGWWTLVFIFVWLAIIAGCTGVQDHDHDSEATFDAFWCLGLCQYVETEVEANSDATVITEEDNDDS